MAIRVKREHLEAIRRHGEETYPNECCGFLIGEKEGDVNVVRLIHPAENEWAKEEGRESKANRYLITPQQAMRAERLAREAALGVIGYYHSHPDHPDEGSSGGSGALQDQEPHPVLQCERLHREVQVEP